MQLRFVAAFALLAASLGAYGHAVVIESRPKDGVELAQSPQNVVLRFNVKVEQALARVSLKTGSAAAVPLALPRVASAQSDRLLVPLPPLQAGNYELRYQVLAADGHITQGVLRFRIAK